MAGGGGGGGRKGGGGGRAPCCDKSKVKKGPWSPAEDLRLVSFIQKHGHPNWRSLPKQAGLLRCGKSCRLRWINYLRPDVKRGNFTSEEEDSIIHLHSIYGNKWSKIASQLPGRTDNEIKNVWNTHLKKRSLLINIDVNKNQTSPATSVSSSSSATSIVSNGTDHDHQDTENIGINSSTPPEMHMSPNDHIKNVQEKLPKRMDEQVAGSSTVTKNQPSWSPASSTVSCDLDLGRKSDDDDDDEVMINNILEIPLESEIEFWNMLDDLQPNTCKDKQQLVIDYDHTPDGLGKAEEMEVDFRKWVRFLEDELGLVGSTTTTAATDQQVDQADQTDHEEQEKKVINENDQPSVSDLGGYDTASWCRIMNDQYSPLWPTSP